MITFLTRVVLKNYKSIAACDVRFGPLTFLVGPNGAGKGNFLDALRFVADSLRSSLEHALRDRGGINDVRRRSGGHPNHFGLRLYFLCPLARRDTMRSELGHVHKVVMAFRMKSAQSIPHRPSVKLTTSTSNPAMSSRVVNKVLLRQATGCTS